MCLPRAAERAWNHPFLKSQCAKQAALQPAANLLEGFLCGENPIGFRCAAETCIPGNWMAADISERHGKLADCGCAFQSWSLADTSCRTLLAARIGFRVVDVLFAGFPCALCRCPDAPSVGIRRSASVGASVGIPLSWLPTQRGNVSMVSASASVTELNVTLRRVGRQNAAHTWEGMGLASSTLAATPCHSRLPSVYRGWLGYGAGRRAELL
jgi:hypothetical protein